MNSPQLQLLWAENALQQLNLLCCNSDVALLCDTNTFEACLPLLAKQCQGIGQIPCLALEPGEFNKSLASLESIYHFLLQHQISRKGTLICLGGGVITDLGGMAAATFKRGIHFAHIPTSLMAMVDASIGGKNAVNIGPHRNMAGVFAAPQSIFFFPELLQTLPAEELHSGWAEMLKHALLQGETAWSDFQKNTVGSIPDAALILSSASFKQEIVDRDFKDENLRQWLNVGHTAAHAIEAWFLQNNREIPHGFAVAAGIHIEIYLSQLVFPDISDEWVKSVQAFVLTHFPHLPLPETAVDEVISFMANDKKNTGSIAFSLLETPGKVQVGIKPGEEQIRTAIIDYIHARNA